MMFLYLLIILSSITISLRDMNQIVYVTCVLFYYSCTIIMYMYYVIDVTLGQADGGGAANNESL